MTTNTSLPDFSSIAIMNAMSVDSPDTKHITYFQHAKQIEIINNVYNGVDSTKQYLYQFPQELATSFEQRKERSTLRNFVKRATEAFTGMIFRKAIEINGWGARTVKSFDKIDKHQNIVEFTKEVTRSVTLDGKTYILVDASRDGTSQPYFVHVKRNQIINWRRDENGNFTMVVIENILARPKGKFGTEYYQQWWHYDENGNISIYEKPEPGADIVQVDYIETDYDGIPLVEVDISEVPILYDVAKLNIKHFNRMSHKDRYLTMAALPIPIIWGADIDEDGKPETAKPALVIGVDEAFMFTGDKSECDFEWRELSGKSIDLLEKDLDSIVEDITTGILRAADTVSTVQKSATEVALLQAEASDRVTTIANAVENAMNEALRLLSLFNNEKVPKDAVFILSKDFNAALSGSDGQRLLFESYLQGLLSIETYLQALSDAELISIESTKKELEKIKNDDFVPVPVVGKEQLPAMDNRTKSAINGNQG